MSPSPRYSSTATRRSSASMSSWWKRSGSALIRRQAAWFQLYPGRQWQSDRKNRRLADSTEILSGVDKFTFMKTTESGWADYVMDKFMSLAEMRDRIAATSMLATWRWTRNPTSFAEANKAILQAMTKELATTYIEGAACDCALEAVPEISEVALAMPTVGAIRRDVFKKSPTC